MDNYNRYPAGKYVKPVYIDTISVRPFIKQLETIPLTLRQVIEPLSAQQLKTKTQPGVWTIEQIVHHLADSHMNAFFRTKLALTEENPTIKPYAEQAWAKLPDATDFPVKESLDIFQSVHSRWCHLLKSLNDTELKRTYYHPDDNYTVTVGEQIHMYVYHANHHIGFIKQLLEARPWI